MEEFNVKFRPKGATIRVPRGTDLLSAAIRAGIVLNAACGGEGLCGKCRVIIKKTEALACETLVESDLEVTVPKESLAVHGRLSHEAEEFTKGVVLKKEGRFAFSPLVRKVYLELPRPTDDDNASDLERISRELRSKEGIDSVNISAKIANVKHLSEIIRESDFKVTVTIGRRNGSLEMFLVEPGDTSNDVLGMAFDIGTTTVAGQLIDLKTKNILGSRIAFNKQAAFGSDVITRIIYASEPKGLAKLNEAVLDNMNEMIEDLAGSAEANLSDIYAVTIAGNMTMMHLLLKIDPANIRKEPYIPATTVFPAMNAPEVGLEINPKGIASFLPGVSTYLGGDIVAGILACGLSESDDISLLADIGTNGEIVLGSKEWMIGAAASAGPAFEGSGLSGGMKAVRGAIEKARIGKGFDVEIETINGEKPRGICGSGYIDLLCQMLRAGIIGKDGKIDRDIKSKRIRRGEANYEFVVAFKSETAAGRDIVIQEDDIENLKRAKAAIYSAVVSLLNKVEKETKDVKKIYVAGGFGNYLNIENSVYIGLLPDVERSIYEFIGNSSLAGARMALLSREAHQKAMAIHKEITYLDLSSEPRYMDEYVAALFFPHTDLGRFPSVRS